MKKLLTSAIVGLALFGLTACSSGNDGSGDSAAKDSDKVTVWAWDETFNIAAMNEAKEVYGDKGKDVEIVTMSQDDIVQKLNTSLASGSTEGLPNIVLIEDYRIQGYLTSYPDAFSDLSDIVKEDDFSAYKFAVNKVDDKIYGVPFDTGVTGLFYRTDLLEEAGYKESDFEDITWDDYIEMARTVKEKTGKAMLSLNPSDLGLARVIMQSAGEWYTDDKGNVTIENNKSLAYGLEVFATLLKDGLADPVSDWDGGVNAVQSGSVASTPNGSWYSSTIQGAEDQKGNWKIAPTPTIAGNADSVHASNLGGSGWYVIKGVDGEAAAKEFLGATFTSDKELMGTLAEKIGVVSTMKAAQETEQYKAGSDFYGGQKVFEDFSKWSTEIPSVNYGMNTYAIESVMVEFAQRVIDGEDTATVLKEAQKQVEAQVAN